MRVLYFIVAYKDVIILLFAGLALRLHRLEELMTIGGDLGYDLIKIKQILSGNLTLLGSPIGRFGDTTLYLGPLYYYLQVPFLILFKLDPAATMIPIIAARSATTLFVYLLTKKFFNSKAAILAAVISTLSPYFLENLGPPSQPYLIPTIVAAVAFLLLKINFKRIALAGFLAGLTVNFHYFGLSIFLALLLYIFYTQDKLRLKALAYLVLGFFLSIFPLFLFELRNNFFLTNQIITQFTSGVVSSHNQSLASQLAQASGLLAKDILGIRLPIWVFLPIVAASVVFAIKNASKNSRNLIFFLTSIIIINLLAALLYSPKVQAHYLASAYVPLFIFVAYLISYTIRLHRIVPFILTVIVAIALIGRNDLSRPSGYTMPEDLTLRQVRQISEIIKKDVASETFNITSTLDGDSRALPYRYLVDVYGKEPLDTQTYDKGEALYVITRDPPASVRESSLFEIASFQPSNIAKTWNINGDIKLIKLSKVKKPQEEVEKFVTIVNPVRGRDLWQDRSIVNLTKQLESINQRDLPSTWLLAYDTLDDQEIVDTFKNNKNDVEIGALLEVSEIWATAAKVPYIIGDGDYYRPDKVFLSGYSPKDREKLIKTYIKKYQKTFGQKPQVAGAWYVDARSQGYLVQESIKALLVVADQYDTDAAASWGKYWSMPFYPSKYNSLEPAASQNLKIPIVNLQWAQRHPISGYGKRIEDSRQSFQANDYINNGFESSYFNNLLDIYLSQQKTDFVQITIGLEAGQEAITFSREFEYQLDQIANLEKQSKLKVVMLSKFSDWYQNEYPGISPSHFLTYQDSFWYMSPKFRVFITKENEKYQLKDLRYYRQEPLIDYFYADKNVALDRKVQPQIEGLDDSGLSLGENLLNMEIIENFDRLTLKSDNRLTQINTRGIEIDGQTLQKVEDDRFNDRKVKFKYLMLVELIKNMTKSALSPIKFSQIESQRTLGLAIGNKLIGLTGFKPGIYDFATQTLVRFQSPADFIDKYQPWLN